MTTRNQLLRSVLAGFLSILLAGCGDTSTGHTEVVDAGMEFCVFCGSSCPEPADWPEAFVCFEPGSFTMGTPDEALPRDNDEASHPVELTRPFFMARTEVTQAEWSMFFENPSWHTAAAARCEIDPCESRPVERVNWYEAIAYMNARSADEGLTACYQTDGCNGTPGRPCSNENNECLGGFICADVTQVRGCTGYRLPTEAEWEYAAAGEASSQTYGALDDSAWYFPNAFLRTHPVGQQAASPEGLSDMFGNVYEWVWDRYARDFGLFGDFSSTAIDPQGGEFDMTRVTRGGSWNSGYEDCRASNRENEFPGQRSFLLGFRVVRNIPPTP